MTELATSAAGDPRVAQWIEVLAQSFAQVLAQIAGVPFVTETLTQAPPTAQAPSETDMHVVITASGSVRGEMSLRLGRESAFALAQLFLSETREAVPDFKPEHREATEELLRQIAGHAATALKPHWGEVFLRMEFGTAPSWPAGVNGWIAAVANSPASFCLEWQMSAALGVALSAPPASSQPSPGAKDSEPSPATYPPAEGIDKLALLMDVELGVVLRFGGRQLLLHEILELGPGSVVELDRQVQQPADLILDGRMIASGEVVVIDGCYGLRILEVVAASSPSNRSVS